MQKRTMAKQEKDNADSYKALERAFYTPEQLLEYDRYAWKEEENSKSN